MTYYTTKFLYLAIPLAFLHTVKCLKIPSISYISEDQIIEKGSDLRLNCSVRNADKAILRWIKIADNQHIILTEGYMVKSPKISILFDGSTLTYNLTIFNFQESDEGIYRCVLAPTLEKRYMSQVQVRMKKSPRIISISMRNAKKKISLECQVTGNPSPQISWKREGSLTFADEMKIYSGNVLRFDDKEPFHLGVYYCQADNGYGPPAIRNFTITSDLYNIQMQTLNIKYQ